jgi:uncharacterized protein (DUF433 family)
MKKLITQDPAILGGKPIIAGTRMSVESVLELISSGISIKKIQEEYPFLDKKHIQAALSYATTIFKKEERYVFRNTHQQAL